MDGFVWIWIGIFVVAILIEVATTDLVSIWFALAAIPSFLLSLFNVDEWVQFLAFILVAVVLIIFTRPLMIKYFRTNEIKTNVDSIIGQEGVCIQDIQKNTIGRVLVRRMEWSAVSNEDILVDEKVRVLDVEGNKLIVKKI
ncbi:MAG: NfeD family protein [Acholeplasmataceae bacterium]|nr:NfeD family protein [Acholeplasmataceae bacterium]